MTADELVAAVAALAERHAAERSLPRLWSPEAIAAHWPGAKVDTIRKWGRTGRLPAVHIGNSVFFREEDLRALTEEKSA